MVQLTSDPVKTKAACIYDVLDLGKQRPLTRAKVERMVTLFTLMAVHHLPRLSSDYPEENKSKFLRQMMKWNDYRARFIQRVLEEFFRDEANLYLNEFVARCTQEKFVMLFDPVSLRDTMNRWIIEDERRGEFVLKKEAFSGRLSEAILQMGSRDSFVSQQKLLKNKLGTPKLSK